MELEVYCNGPQCAFSKVYSDQVPRCCPECGSREGLGIEPPSDDGLHEVSRSFAVAWGHSPRDSDWSLAEFYRSNPEALEKWRDFKAVLVDPERFGPPGNVSLRDFLSLNPRRGAAAWQGTLDYFKWKTDSALRIQHHNDFWRFQVLRVLAGKYVAHWERKARAGAAT